MFSSKKFKDIMAKHKKFTRYNENEEHQDDSLMELQSNRKSNNQMEVVDIVDDEKDVISQNENNKESVQKQDISKHESPIPENCDKIRKVEMIDTKEEQTSRELKFEDLSQSKKQNSRIQNEQNNSFVEPSDSKKATERIFTTSINLMENDLLPDERELQNSKTHDDREDSLTKAPEWNFIGSNRHIDTFQKEPEEKNLTIDDYDDFKSDHKSSHNEDEYQDPDVTDNAYEYYENSDDNNSVCINEELDNNEDFQ